MTGRHRHAAGRHHAPSPTWRTESLHDRMERVGSRRDVEREQLRRWLARWHLGWLIP